jgi:hypothetical protein
MRLGPPRKVVGFNRAVALLLAAVWLFGGMAGVYFGVARSRYALAGCGAAAIWYAVQWLRVVVRSRLLSWRELIAPWRAAGQRKE